MVWDYEGSRTDVQKCNVSGTPECVSWEPSLWPTSIIIHTIAAETSKQRNGLTHWPVFPHSRNGKKRSRSCFHFCSHSCFACWLHNGISMFISEFKNKTMSNSVTFGNTPTMLHNSKLLSRFIINRITACPVGGWVESDDLFNRFDKVWNLDTTSVKSSLVRTQQNPCGSPGFCSQPQSPSAAQLRCLSTCLWKIRPIRGSP